MKKGDIILIPFPFSDLTGNKNRPALVLIEGELDITVAFISTQIHWKSETDILIQPTNENGLKKESLIRLSKLATLDKDLALGLLGEIDSATVKHLNKNLRMILQIED